MLQLARMLHFFQDLLVCPYKKKKVHVVGHHFAEDTFPKKEKKKRKKAVKRDFLKHLNSTDFITFPWMSYISCRQVVQKIV